MKNLNNFIQEKLVINKNIKFDGNNLDDLNGNQPETIYDSQDVDDDNQYDFWDDCKSELDMINNDYYGFLAYKDLSIMDSKNSKNEGEPNEFSTDLFDLIDIIITGRDYGYRVRLVGGHLEIDCVNSGSCLTWYIYAISEEGYNMVEDWYNGMDDIDNLNFLFNDNEQKYIQCIEQK